MKWIAIVMLAAAMGAGAQTKQEPLKCGKYQHVDDSLNRICGDLSPEMRYQVELCKQPTPPHCEPDLHTVTEAEWQELKKHVSELEKPLCVKKAGMVWELWDCKVAPPKKAVAPSHPPAK